VLNKRINPNASPIFWALSFANGRNANKLSMLTPITKEKGEMLLVLYI
jgi:hypothetical protein